MSHATFSNGELATSGARAVGGELCFSQLRLHLWISSIYLGQ